MRLHHLTVTAFGPFPGSEEVDFDALNEAGLFLLSGATGAGKTSILDAVSFALYGVVPGVRGVKALKSQHAADLTPPEVVLEFSVRERRFRIRRSPEWTRPKLRGTGTRTEKPAASLAELTGDEELFLTSRAAEVGLLISDLIGMGASQFQQVALLPQGEFQRFLHATSQERHDVLQKLFQTDRFSRIEDWVNEHSRRLRERSSRSEETVRNLLHTLADRVGATVGDGADEVALLQDGALPADGGLSWATKTYEVEAARLRVLDARHHAAEGALRSARSALVDLQSLAAIVARRDEAQATLVELSSSEAESEQLAARLDADRRAAAAHAVLDLLDKTVEQRRASADALDRAVRELTGLDGLLSPALGTPGCDAGPVSMDDLASLDRELRARATRVEALLPRVRALVAASAAVDALGSQIDRVSDERADVAARRELLPERLRDARTALQETVATALRLEALELQETAAAERADAARQVRAGEERLARLREAVRDRRDAAADARELVQTLVGRRLAGVAAELAGRLVEGSPCQVCGGTEHPAPAAPSTDPVSEVEQQAAETAYEAAQAALVRATEQATAAEGRLIAMRERSGGLDPDDAEMALSQLRRHRAEAQVAQASRLEAEREIHLLEEQLEQVDDQLAATDMRLAELRQRRESEEQTLDAARCDIASVVDEVDPADLPAMQARLATAIETVSAARVASEEHERIGARVSELDAQARATAAAQGFADLEAVRAAFLAAEERAGVERLLSRRVERSAAARSVLREPAVAELGDSPAPDLVEADRAVNEADLRTRECARERDLQADRVRALDGLTVRLGEALAAWAPLHEECTTAESMSRLVRGMGSDNHLQMRLSAYVLATRLDQVLAAANERLSHMRDQRYLLQRTGRAHRKGSQAGLGLEVVDQWTGDVRDPATLSGGETFVVSLSLALGLADVVSQEAGGTEIETLFVDEGFGSLDADTLDDVMDRLDGLRAGGRTVGVVSHVAELRTRIPAQLHVEKTPQGSTISVGTLVG